MAARGPRGGGETAPAKRLPAPVRGASMIAGGGNGKSSAAALSIASNTLLIVAKIAAAAATGSIAILTEAIHSGIDLMASVIAFLSVRKSDRPPDRGHPFGHGKIEELAAVIEGMLIIVGAGIIVYEGTHRLVVGSSVSLIGVGIGVMAASVVINLLVSSLLARRARETRSPALAADAAHLRTDAATSLAVFVGLGLVELTGYEAFDSVTALLVAAAIVGAGLRILSNSSRVLVDQSLPEPELRRVRDAIGGHGAPEVIGFHKLRARGGVGSRHIDLHVQFGAGTTLERAHEIAHELQDTIRDELGGADVLIHVEPWTSSREEGFDEPRRHRRPRRRPREGSGGDRS